MIAYVRWDGLTLTWTILSLIGLAAALWHVRETWLDRRALDEAGGDYPARRNVVRAALIQEFLRIIMHCIFAGVGLVATFVAPHTIGYVGGKVIMWAFGIAPGLLAVASLSAIVFRRRLIHIISKQQD